MNLKTEDVTTFMQQGRGAMTNNPFNRYINYNDPKASKYPGKIAIVALARKLMVALWRYLQTGLVPVGAVMHQTSL